MKKINRVISTIVLTCFLFNTASITDLAFSQPIDYYKNSDKLATPSELTDIVGIQPKDRGRIKFALEGRLKELDNAGLLELMGNSTAGLRNEYLIEHTRFNPVDMHFFWYEARSTKAGYCVKVELKDLKYKPRTYYATFSLIKDDSGGFAINVYTEEQHKATDGFAKGVPQIKVEDTKAVNRYVENNEKIIDPWIAEKMKDPDNYIEIKHKTHDDIGDDFLSAIYQADPYPFEDLNSIFKNAIRGLLVTLMMERKIVIIKVKKGEKRPVISEIGKDGKEKKIEVGSHTSQNALYIFLDEEGSGESKGLLMFKYFKHFHTHAGMGDVKALVAAYECIMPKLFHEMGAACMLDYEITKDGRIINDMDRLYEMAYVSQKSKEEMERDPLIKRLKQKLSFINQNKDLPNLDFLRGEKGESARDYAAGKEPDALRPFAAKDIDEILKKHGYEKVGEGLSIVIKIALYDIAALGEPQRADAMITLFTQNKNIALKMAAANHKVPADYRDKALKRLVENEAVEELEELKNTKSVPADIRKKASMALGGSEREHSAKPDQGLSVAIKITQAAKNFFGKLRKIGHIISQDGCEGLGDIPKILKLIKERIIGAFTTNNSIMFNILTNMAKTILKPAEFIERFLKDRKIDLEGKDLKFTPIVGRLLKAIEEDPNLALPANKDKLLRKVYNDINEKDIAGPIGAALEAIWNESEHRHGYISVEPFTDIVLSGDVDRIVDECIAKFKRIQEEIFKINGTRPRNILIKLPVTDPGLAAGEILISRGYNVNFTLIATAGQYKNVIDTYKKGMRKFVENKWHEIVESGDQKISGKNRIREFKKQVKEFIAQSVASVFVSRDDRNIYTIINDKTFGEMIKHLNMRLDNEKNNDKRREIEYQILLFKAMAEPTAGNIKNLNDFVLPVSKQIHDKKSLSELKNQVLAKFDSLKVKDEGKDLVPVTKVGVAFAKAELWGLFQQEFEKDQGWKDFIDKYDLPKELMPQQIYFASTGVKVKKIGPDGKVMKDVKGKDIEVYTTHPFYVKNLVANNVTDTFPYPGLYLLAESEKAPFEPEVQIDKNVDEARKVLEDLKGLGIDLDLIKREVIFKDGLKAFGDDDMKSLKIIEEALTTALEIKKLLDTSATAEAKQSRTHHGHSTSLRAGKVVMSAGMRFVIDRELLESLVGDRRTVLYEIGKTGFVITLGRKNELRKLNDTIANNEYFYLDSISRNMVIGQIQYEYTTPSVVMLDTYSGVFLIRKDSVLYPVFYARAKEEGGVYYFNGVGYYQHGIVTNMTSKMIRRIISIARKNNDESALNLWQEYERQETEVAAQVSVTKSRTEPGKSLQDRANHPDDVMLPSEGLITGISNFTIKQFIETFVPKDNQANITEEVLKVLKNSLNTAAAQKDDTYLLSQNFNSVMERSSDEDSDNNLFHTYVGYELRKLLINPIIARAEPDKYGIVNIPAAVTRRSQNVNVDIASVIVPLTALLKVLDGDKNKGKSDHFYNMLRKETGQQRFDIDFIKNEFRKHVLQLFASRSITIVDYERALKGTPALDSSLTTCFLKPFAGKLGFTSGIIRIMGNSEALKHAPNAQQELQQAAAEEILVHFFQTRVHGRFSHSTINDLSKCWVNAADLEASNKEIEAISKKIRKAPKEKVPLNKIEEGNPLDLLLSSNGNNTIASAAEAIAQLYTPLPQYVEQIEEKINNARQLVNDGKEISIGDLPLVGQLVLQDKGMMIRRRGLQGPVLTKDEAQICIAVFEEVVRILKAEEAYKQASASDAVAAEQPEVAAMKQLVSKAGKNVDIPFLVKLGLLHELPETTEQNKPKYELTDNGKELLEVNDNDIVKAVFKILCNPEAQTMMPYTKLIFIPKTAIYAGEMDGMVVEFNNPSAAAGERISICICHHGGGMLIAEVDFYDESGHFQRWFGPGKGLPLETLIAESRNSRRWSEWVAAAADKVGKTTPAAISEKMTATVMSFWSQQRFASRVPDHKQGIKEIGQALIVDSTWRSSHNLAHYITLYKDVNRSNKLILGWRCYMPATAETEGGTDTYYWELEGDEVKISDILQQLCGPTQTYQLKSAMFRDLEPYDFFPVNERVDLKLTPWITKLLNGEIVPLPKAAGKITATLLNSEQTKHVESQSQDYQQQIYGQFVVDRTWKESHNMSHYVGLLEDKSGKLILKWKTYVSPTLPKVKGWSNVVYWELQGDKAKITAAWQQLANAPIDLLRKVLERDLTFSDFSPANHEINARLTPWVEKLLNGKVVLSPKQEIADMTQIASEAGKQIPTNTDERYNLLVDNNMYKDGEREKDVTGYMTTDGRRIAAGDRFNLEQVDTSNVDNILAHVKNPERTIVQVSNELSKEALDELKTKAPGIRILRIDTKDFKYDKNLTDIQRQMCRFDLYTMMLAARRITEEDRRSNNSICRTLEFLVRTHCLKTGEGITATDYIQAILNNDFARLIKANLSYKPIEIYNVPEYNNVAASLVSA